MTARRGIGVGLAVLGLALLVAWFRPQAEPPPSLPTREIPTAMPATESRDPVLRSRDTALDAERGERGFAPPASAPAAAPAMLFDAAIPLSERIEELDRRARRGEAAAGCQLGVELQQCARVGSMQSYFENLEQQVSRHGTRGGTVAEIDARIDAAIERRDLARKVLASCRSIDARRWAEPARYLHAAAQAGHVPAMRLALSASLYYPAALMRDPGLIEQFRASAPRYFAALWQRGDSQLLERWSVARMQTGDPLLQVLPPPWNRPELATAMMRQRIEQARPEGDSAGPDTDPPELRREAMRLYAEYFAPHEARELAERTPVGSRKFGDLSIYRCEALNVPQSARR